MTSFGRVAGKPAVGRRGRLVAVASHLLATTFLYRPAARRKRRRRGRHRDGFWQRWARGIRVLDRRVGSDRSHDHQLLVPRTSRVIIARRQCSGICSAVSSYYLPCAPLGDDHLSTWARGHPRPPYWDTKAGHTSVTINLSISHGVQYCYTLTLSDRPTRSHGGKSVDYPSETWFQAGLGQRARAAETWDCLAAKWTAAESPAGRCWATRLRVTKLSALAKGRRDAEWCLGKVGRRSSGSKRR
jgi:hypothetical protein